MPSAIPMAGAKTKTRLNKQQILGFWAAWAGWTLDGMDSVIYALVLAPALTELLPKSGVEATPANVGFTGSILFALFLVGWGCSFIWGPIADRFGRAKSLGATILVYSVFTGARLFAKRMAIGPFPFSCRNWHRRGMGDGWHLCRRSLARRSPQDGRRLSPDRILFRLFPGRCAQLHRRRAFRLARHVPLRPCASHRFVPHSLEGERAGTLGGA